jgi:hypothetical protein
MEAMGEGGATAHVPAQVTRLTFLKGFPRPLLTQHLAFLASAATFLYFHQPLKKGQAGDRQVQLV